MCGTILRKELESVKEEKDLGLCVIITTDLKSSSHMHQIRGNRKDGN